MAIGYLIAAVLAAAVAVFALQNGAPTPVRFLAWNLEGIPLAGLILGALAAGLVIAGIPLGIQRWTARAQASYVFNRRWEPFVQYEYINFDPNELSAGAQNQVHAIRAGANYFLFGHNAKLTADATYLPNGLPVSDDASGTVQSNRHNEILARVQFQLLL